MDAEVQTIILDRNTSLQNIKGKIFEVKGQVINNENYNKNKKREEIFRAFSKTYLNETEKKYSINKDVSILNDYYDKFIVGSDQVWNPQMSRGSSVYFLQFAEKSKRISYSASFGVSELEKEVEQDYKKWVNFIPHISVREEDGAKLIKKMTGQDVPVLADPTMLLTKEEWLFISKRASNRPDESYLLTYFLGGPTDETRENLDKIASEKNMKIINLGDITEKETYETGPSEFLDYINNASAFFTDSFHGVVFSLIFETPFIVFERNSTGPSMYSRIETLLKKFDMKNREAKGFNEDIFSMDFSGTKEIFNQEYEKSINYLKNALRIED